MEFTQEQAAEIITKAVADFKGAFTPEMTQKIEALKTELLTEIKGAITQEQLNTTISALELKMDQFAEKMKPTETKSVVERFTAELTTMVEELKAGAKEWRLILDGVQTLNDFKSSVEYFANHVACCEKQLDKYVQYHLGNPYYYHASDLSRIKRACINVCYQLGYELYSPNGFWYVKSIK